MDDAVREALDSPHYFDDCPARELCATHNNDEMYHRCPQCGLLKVVWLGVTDYGTCTECKVKVLFDNDDGGPPTILTY